MRSREMRDLVVIVIVIALFMWGVTFTTSKAQREDAPLTETASAQMKGGEETANAAMVGQQPQPFVPCNKGKVASSGGHKVGGRHHGPQAMAFNGGGAAPVVDLAGALNDTSHNLTSGHVEGAFAKADSLTQQFANNPNVWVMRGRCNEAAGRHAKALDDAQMALRLDNTLVEAWELQVVVLNSLDRKREAEESRQKMLQLTQH